ncbi:MAG TPA: peptidase inhibitor family I36 protein [Vicinamibacterales bacterium]|nr:peptidase inhibitor family I36 protein [Vicinamibacterales bacterium]
MRKAVTYLGLLSVALFVSLFGAQAAPSWAGRSACTQTYVCAWNDAGWVGTMIQFQPSAIYQETPAHCLNFNNTSSQDAISSLASYNGAPNFRAIFHKDVNCVDPDPSYVYTLYGLGQVKDLKGTGFNDTFSSIEIPDCC